MSEEQVAGAGGLCSACLVVPCYNEADRLDTKRFREFVLSSTSAALLFVDDGSRDDTLRVLQDLQKGCENRMGILSLKQNSGKAEAVRRGILRALDTIRPQAVGFWDADLATPLDAMDSFLNVLEERPEVEMVFGARVKLLGRHVERRAIRHYLGRVFATAVSSVLELPIYDTQCGAKLFRVRSETRRIFEEPFLSRWVFDVEIIARYINLWRLEKRRPEIAIYEYPLERWVDVAGSKVRAVDFFVALCDVLRIRRRYHT